MMHARCIRALHALHVRLVACAAALAIALLPSRTRADAGFPIPDPGWYSLVGGNVGMSLLARQSNGAVLGAEASIVHLGREATWAGGYIDVVHDTSWNTQRISIGPELGLAMFGIDGGYLMQLDHGALEHGVVVRPLITFGVVALYGRYGHLFIGDGREDFGELGLLLKYPINLSHDH
jgi:hypothetical protein